MVNMNQPDSDGVDDLVEQQVRVGMSMLGQLGMVAMRGRELAERREEHHERAATQQARERHIAERDVAHALLTATRDPGWWEHASPQEVGRTYVVADAWARTGDPLATSSRDYLASSIQDRYGLSPVALQAMVNETERERDHARADADRAERTASSDRTEASTSPEAEPEPPRRRVPPWEDEPEVDPDQRPTRDDERDVSVAQLADGAEDARRGHAYDSAERREAFAQRMRSEGVEDQLVADRLRSDMSQSRPPSDAVRARSAAGARPARHGAAAVREVARGR